MRKNKLGSSLGEWKRTEEYRKFKTGVFGRHSTFWNWSKQSTIEKLEDFISDLLSRSVKEAVHLIATEEGWTEVDERMILEKLK